MRIAISGLFYLSLAASSAAAQVSASEPDETEQGFETATLPDSASEASNTRRDPIGILSGAEVEGILTQSVILDSLKDTPIYFDSMPVGLLLSTIAVPGQMETREQVPCTVTLIDSNVVITAWHCYPGVVGVRRTQGYQASNALVSFGYYSENSRPKIYGIKRVVDADQELDYAVLELDAPRGRGSPGERFGYVNLALDVSTPVPLRVFHHPYGYFKMVLQDATCRGITREGGEAGILYHQCDTRGGSSGSALLSYQKVDGRPIAFAIHLTGNRSGLIDANLHFNRAVSIGHIAQNSRYIENIGCIRFLGDWDCPNRDLALGTDVFFDFDGSDVTPETAAKLDELITQLGGVQLERIELYGHAEDNTSRQYAIGLSVRRAESVRAYLEGRGVSVPISVEGMGSSEAYTPGRNVEFRRVHVKVAYRPYRG